MCVTCIVFRGSIIIGWYPISVGVSKSWFQAGLGAVSTGSGLRDLEIGLIKKINNKNQ